MAGKFANFSSDGAPFNCVSRRPQEAYGLRNRKLLSQSERTASVQWKPLTFRAGLKQYQKQGNELLHAFKAGDPEAVRVLRRYHPRVRGRADTNDRNPVTEPEIRAAGVTQADARCVVARLYGFRSWATLATHIEALNKRGSRVLKFESAVEAIISGNLTGLKALLRENPKLVHARSTREHHATLLHYVGANGVEDYRQKTPKNAVKILEVLLKAGAEVDADLGYSPAMQRRYPERMGSATLGMVATSCHPAQAGVQIALLRTLLDHGARVDGLPGRWNPLVAALHNGRGEAAEFLARNGARLDLEGAAGVGRLDVLRTFFKKDGTLKANATKAQLEYGFMWACEYGRTRVVAYLLSRGIDVAAQTHGETGLHWAAYGGHSEIVRLLLNRNAPVEAVDKRFCGTPLGWALYGWRNPPPESKHADYYKVVELLVAAGANVDPQWLADDPDRPQNETMRGDRRMLEALRGEKPRPRRRRPRSSNNQ
jgi:ankyrin repeat protein